MNSSSSSTQRRLRNACGAARSAVAECLRACRRSCGAALDAVLSTAALALPALHASAQTAPVPAALPTGGQVVAGQAGIARQGATLTVNQSSPRAAIDWASFDVGSQAQVTFAQPSSGSVTLNRVQGGSPSQIFGRISANGQVFLSNPGGVYFAPGARVDVGGLVATTHRISLDDFMAGTARFERDGASGSVVNAGELKAALGGYVALLAPEVRNQGVILARLGTVALAAGESFELQFDSANTTLAHLRVAPATMRALVDNRSAVLAPGGLVILSAQALDRVQGGVVRNSGRIEATGLAQRGGRIVLDASDRIENTGTLNAAATAQGPAGSVSLQAPEVVNDGAVQAGGSPEHAAGGQVQVVADRYTQGAAAAIDVSAPLQGGSVDVQAGASVALAGSVLAAATGSAAETPARGGSVSVQAARIELDSATVDASGGQGGRVVLDSSSARATVAAATSASVSTPAAPTEPLPLPLPEPGRLALAGATQINTRGRRGSGGSIALLGDDIALRDTTALDASGALGGGTARVGGGWQGGEGLHQATTVAMGADARIDVSATDSGHGGSAVLWSDVTRAGSTTSAAGRIAARGGAASGDGGRVETSGHAVDTAGLRVDAAASRGSAGLWLIDPYNYTINGSAATAIASTLNTGTSVTVSTSSSNTGYGGSSNSADAGDITLAATIAKTAGADATLTLLAQRHIAFGSGSGVTAAGSGKLNLVLRARATGAALGTIDLNNATVTTNGGHVWLGGGSAAGDAWNGLTVGNGAATATAGTGNAAVGLYLRGGTVVSTGGGSVYASGLSTPASGTASDIYGLVLDNARIGSGSGAIALAGSAQGAYNYASGIDLRNGSALATTSGAITLRGTTSASNTPTDKAFGTYLHDKVSVASDSGAVNVYGTATANSAFGTGIWLGSTAATGGDGNQASGVGNGYDVAVVSNSGNVLMDARGTNSGTGNWFHGFVLLSYGGDKQLIKTGSGNVTIKGYANVAKDDSSGVQFQVGTSSGALHVVSTSGDIYVQGFQQSGSTHAQNNALRFTPGDSDGSIRFGAVSDGAGFTGKLTFEADSIWNYTGNTSRAGAIKAYGSGGIAFQPSADTSTKDFSLTGFWGFGSAHSSFAIGKPTERKNITLGADITAAGPISVQGGDITLNANLTSTLAGAGIRLAARGTVWSTTSANTLTTSGGAVVIAADSDGDDSGSIQFSQGLTIDTRVGGATSGGGAITLGGGNALGSGYAAGISAGDAEGIRVDNGLTLRSGGGDINLRGRSWVGTVANTFGAWGVGFWNGSTTLTADSGSGRIRIEGIGRSNGAGAFNQGIVARQGVDLRSAWAGADAITLLGSNTGNSGGSLIGIDMGANNPIAAAGTNKFIASGAGGGITLQGQGSELAVALRNGTQLLGNGGALRLNGTGTGAQLRLENAGNQWWGSAASSAITASSSPIALQFDTFQFGGANPNIASSGSFTLAPVATSASFGQYVSTQWFALNQNGQTIGGLTLGKPGNAGAAVYIDGSSNSSATAVVVNGPVAAYGSTLTVTSPLTVTGSGDILLRGYQDSNSALTVNNTISKTGGGDATLTLRAAGRLSINSGIGASGAGTGKLNIVAWADSDGDRFGGASFGGSNTLASNGGHIWIGGSATPDGSATWNGLTVGNGASPGAYGANYNGLDLRGTFNTGGGDFYAAGKTYVTTTTSNWDINATGGSVVVNAGSGNVTFVGNRIDFGGIYTAGVTTSVTTTGTLTIRPYEDSFGYGFNVKGALSGSDWAGTLVSSVSSDANSENRAAAVIANGTLAGTANLVILNVASLGGLVIGKASSGNAVTVRNSLAIAGDISVYGGRIANAGSAAFTSSGGSILLDADLDATQNIDAAGIYWKGALTASSSSAGKGNITLLGRGGTKAGNANHGVFVDTTSVVSAGGDVTISGRAPAASNTGVLLGSGASVAAGRTLAVDGRSAAPVSASDNVGLRLSDGAQLASAGAMGLVGEAGTGTSQALQVLNGASLATSGTGGSAGIALTALNGGSIASSVAGGGGGNNTAASVTAGAGSGITLTADRLDVVASRPLTLSTTGVLAIQPASANFPATFTWDGSLASGHFTGAGSLANVKVNTLAGLGGLTLGKAGNTSNIVVGAGIAAAGPIQLHGQDLALNAGISASGNATAASNRIVLTAGGNVTQTAALSAYGLSLQGGGRYVLDNAGNDVAVLAAGSGATPLGRISYVDANGLTIGSVGAASGISAGGSVRIETLTGDLSVSANVASASTAIDALVLNAGRAKGVADGDFLAGAGGNITLSNSAVISVGSGGRATLYSGSVAASTGLAALVGSGSGRFRYASDEVTTNYLSALGTGLHAVYREQPTLTLKGVDQSVVYGTEPLLAVSASGRQNGDTTAQSMGRLPGVTLMDGGSAAGRNASGNLNVRRDGSGNVVGYGMALTRNAASSLGYALAYDDSGTTTVTPKALSAVINDDAKFTGLADTPGYAGATFSGFVRGETAADVSAAATIVRSGMGANQGTGDAAGTYAGVLSGSVSVTAGNYTLNPANVTAGNYHIVGPDTLIVRVGSAGAVYGGSAAYDVTQVRYYDSVAHAETSLTQGSSEFNWTLGGNAAQAVNFTLASAGVDVGSHAISGTVANPHTLPGTGSGGTPSTLLAIGGRLQITPRTLTVSASKVYDGSDTLTGNVTLGNLVGGQTLAVTEAHASDRNAATPAKYVRQLTLADGSGLASNYQLPSLAAYDATANSATITPRPLGVAVDKVYDGLASASAAQTTLSNLAAGEALAIQGVQLSSAHVAAAGKFVSGLTLADSGPFLVGNYGLPSLAAAGARNAVTIAPKTLSVGVASASNTTKTYDGGTAAGSGFAATLSVDGYVAGDSGTLGGQTAAYDTRTVDATRIQLSGLALTGLTSSVGSLTSDYAVDAAAAFTAGRITPRTVSAASAANPTKVYDGSTSVNGALVALATATSGTGKVTGDDLAIVAAGGSYSSADVGSGRSYTLADIALAGADARNYVLSSATISGSDGVVTPRPLTLTASKVYDGGTALSGVTLGNLAAGEYLLVGAAASSSPRVGGPDGNVATADNFVRTITLSNVVDGGTTVNKTANYSLPGSSSGVTSGAVNTLNAAAGNTATLTAAPLTVALAETQVSKVYDGSAAAAAGYAPGWLLTGLVSGDSAATLTQSASFDAAGVAGAASFTLSGIAVSAVTGSNGSVGSDYAPSTNTLTLPGSITPRPLAVDTSGVRKTYDATTGFANLAIGLTAVAGNGSSGLVAGDAANVTVVASGGGFDSKDAGSAKSYALTGLALSGSAAGNYRIASGDSISGLNGIVDPKQVTVTGLAATTKVYDGGTAAASDAGAPGTLSTVAPGGNTGGDGRVYTGDDVALQGGTSAGVYDHKDVATATRVDYTGFGLVGADAGNYVAVGSASATITPKALTATTTLAAKTYDGSTAATVTGTVLAGLVGSETLGVTTSATLDSAHAGARIATLAHVLANGGSGGLAANYSLAGATQALTVAAKALTIAGTTVAGKTYDGSTTAAATAGTLSGLVAGESLNVAAAGTFSSKDAGSRSASVAYTLSNGTGGLAADYSLAGQSGFAAVIARRTVSLSGSKTYDGTAVLSGAQLTLGGLVGSETLAFSGASASNAHVATAGKFVSAVTLLDGSNGGLAANYQLPALNAANAPVAIAAKTLTGSAAIGGMLVKTYDGSTAATGASVGGSVSGAVSGDVLTLNASGVTLAYDSAHVAAASQIAAMGSVGFAIGSSSHGSLASDYSFSAPTIAAAAAGITPRTLTATLTNSGVGKVYDGGSAAPAGFVPGWNTTGLVAGDSAASLTHTAAAYDSKDVATASKVTVGGIALAGIGGSNGSAVSDYALASTSADVAAAITPKGLLLSAAKTYDGTTALSAGQVTLAGLVGSETLAIGGAASSNAHVATAGKFVSAITLGNGSSGGLAANYALPTLNAGNAPVTIAAKTLTATATIGGTLIRTYDGSTAASGAGVGGSVSGAVPGDVLTLDASGLTLAYDSAHVAAASQIAATGSVGFAIGSSSHGSLASDYAFSAPSVAAAAASITPKTLTATLTNSGTTKTYDGSTTAPAGFVPGWATTGLIAGDSAASLTHAGAAYDSQDVGTASKVTVSGIVLNGIAGSNGSAASDYALASASADVAATIAAKGLLLSASKVYDGTTALSVGQVALTGLVGSETLAISGATSSDAHVGAPGKFVSAVALADGSNGGRAANYQLPALDATSAPVTIAPKALTATAGIVGALGKTYDGGTAAIGAGIGGTVAGAVAGDTIALDLGGITLAYDSAHVAAASQIAATGSVGFAIGSSSQGSLVSDYVFSAPTIAAAAAGITPKTLTATLTNSGVGKVYDGSTAAPAGFVPGWSTTGLVAGDSAASLTHTAAAYDSKDVATASRVTVGGIALGGISGSNGSAVSDYALASSSADVAAAITPAGLLLSAAKTYDGTTALGSPHITLGGLVGSETLTVSGAASSGAHVATVGKFVSAITLADGGNGGLAANYALPTLNASNAPVSIAAKTLTASAAIVGASSKTYDGTTAAAGAGVGGSVSGAVPGDVLTLDASGLTLAYDSAHVAAASQIAATGSVGFAIGSSSHGSVASDYAFNAPSVAAAAASITPKTLTATLTNSGTTKTYDGSTTAPAGFVPGWATTGLIAGDSAASLAHAAAGYDSQDVATASKVTVNGVVPNGIAGSNGSAASDYTLASTSADASAAITPKGLLLSAAKTYDGNTALSAGQVTLTGLIGSETLAISAATSSDAHVAAPGNHVSAVGLADGGNGGLVANYMLPMLNAGNAPVAVAPKALTANAAIGGALGKTYDGSTAAIGAGVGGAVTGAVAGDTIALDVGAVTLAYDSAHVAAASQITATGAVGFTIGASSHGSLASDYAFAAPSVAAAAAAIAPKTLTATLVNGGVSKTYDGGTAVPAGFAPGWAIAGLVPGDSAASLSHGAAAYDSKDVAVASKVTLSGIALNGISSGNGSAVSDYVLASTQADVAAAIVLKTLTLSGSKTYDGSTALGSSQVALAGLVGNETLISGGATASDAHVATAGTFVSAVTLLDGANGGLAANYALPALSSATAPVSIAARSLTATAAIGGTLGKTYDGSTAAGGASVGGTVIGAVAGDAVVLDASGITLAYDSAHVAAASQIVAIGPVGFTLASSSHGSQRSDYVFTAPTVAAAAAGITPMTLTATLANSGVAKSYDGGTAPPAGFVPDWRVAGLVGGDSAASLGHGAAAYDSKDVATASRIVVSGVTLGSISGSHGSAASNYALASGSADVAAAIVPKTLTLSGSKTYDGSTALGGGQVALAGLVGSETLLASGATASDAHVATAGTFISAVTLLDGSNGGLAANYALPTLNAATAPVSIAARALTATVAIVGTLNKVYDGSTAATGAGVAGLVSGAVAGDTLTLDTSGVTLAYDSAHVAAASRIGASGSVGFSIVGSTAHSLVGDYAFTAPVIAPVAARIAPATLTATLGNAGVAKIYDGGTAAPAGFVPGWAVAGLVPGDSSASLRHGDAAYDSKDVAAASRLTLSGIALDAISGRNGSVPTDYVLSSASADVAAAITPRPVAVNGLAASGKTYDGTSIAAVTDWGRVATGVGDETLALSPAAAAFADANAGSAKVVTASGYVLADGSGGGRAANYVLRSTSATTSADIARAQLTVTANDDAKFVTQADSSGYGGVSYAGFVNGETAAVLQGSAGVVRSNAGVESAGSYAAVLVPETSALQSPNYSFVGHNGSYTIVPSNRLLVRVAPASSVYGTSPGYTVGSASYFDGSAVHPLTLAVGPAGSDSFTASDGVGGSATFTVAPAAAVSTPAGRLAVGAYQLAATGVSTTNAQNFDATLTLVGSLAVTPKAVSAGVAGGVSKVYDGGTTMNGVALGLLGLEAGDRVQVSGHGSFASRNAGVGIAYTLSDLVLGGADAANYVLAGSGLLGGANGTITPRLLTVDYGGVAKVYDGNSTASVTTRDDRVAGDVLNVVWNAAFADKNVGLGKAVSVGNVALSGADAANYSVAPGGQARADITRLASVSWTGGAGGNWFDPANWTGGAVPDLANVAQVVIPAGTVVAFDTSGARAPAQSGPVQIDGLGSGGSLVQRDGELQVGAGGITLSGYTQTGGRLDSRGSVRLDRFAQSGGSTTVGGDFGVLSDFDQSSLGQLAVQGRTSITDTAGASRLGNVSSAGDLAVAGGGVTQAAGTAIVAAGATAVDAGGGNVVLDAAGNNFGGAFSAHGHDVRVVDGTGGLVLGDIAAGGALGVVSTGGDVTQAAGRTVQVSGSTTIDAGASDIRLDGPGNDLAGSLNARGRNVWIDAIGDLTLGNVTGRGRLVVTSQGGDVLQAAGTRIGMQGEALLNAAAGRIRLDGHANGFAGGLALDSSEGSQRQETPVVLLPGAPAVSLPLPVQAPPALAAAPQGTAADGGAVAIRPAEAARADGGVVVTLLREPSADVAGAMSVLVSDAAALAGFSVPLPAAWMADPSPAASISVLASDGTPLPTWLRFVPDDRRLVATTVPRGGLPLRLTVQQGSRSAIISLVGGGAAAR